MKAIFGMIGRIFGNNNWFFIDKIYEIFKKENREGKEDDDFLVKHGRALANVIVIFICIIIIILKKLGFLVIS